ncbi:tRNA1(Val) A37 N6-methylase TrmN6 [Bacillus oleivorans]|uniref:tRNA1(Val) A37 N6-methylase TrmN6 n=1 Tax=Bacillus oleivorans TaxID=1448271 RepID=A0A285D7E0_9BACI|nr:tRNA1(Val) (adenine(37)-N6)-methyltransferase [Bacillus oleivorans]SNX75722.1 tRNA1(Val) A37 N6-methylase TrmN6 [Bacillus oleivorans]
MDWLKDDERLDYLLAENLRIIQSPTVFSFSLDAVLLARFAYVPIQKGQVLDLCSGNGVIPLLLSGRTRANVTGVEIQERLYNMAVRSILLNGLDDQIQMIHGDLKEMPSILGHAVYDVITCNPPYFQTLSKEVQNQNYYFALARHEITCTLEDVISVSAKLVKPGGKVALVHRPARLMDILMLLRHYKLEPKRLRFVYPKEGKEANMILVEGMKDANPDLKILPPLYIYTNENEYTEEVRELLYGKQ